jgi:hypothetical protein
MKVSRTYRRSVPRKLRIETKTINIGYRYNTRTRSKFFGAFWGFLLYVCVVLDRKEIYTKYKGEFDLRRSTSRYYYRLEQLVWMVQLRHLWHQLLLEVPSMLDLYFQRSQSISLIETERCREEGSFQNLLFKSNRQFFRFSTIYRIMSRKKKRKKEIVPRCDPQDDMNELVPLNVFSNSDVEEVRDVMHKDRAKKWQDMERPYWEWRKDKKEWIRFEDSMIAMLENGWRSGRRTVNLEIRRQIWKIDVARMKRLNPNTNVVLDLVRRVRPELPRPTAQDILMARGIVMQNHFSRVYGKCLVEKLIESLAVTSTSRPNDLHAVLGRALLERYDKNATVMLHPKKSWKFIFYPRSKSSFVLKELISDLAQALQRLLVIKPGGSESLLWLAQFMLSKSSAFDFIRLGNNTRLERIHHYNQGISGGSGIHAVRQLDRRRLRKRLLESTFSGYPAKLTIVPDSAAATIQRFLRQHCTTSIIISCKNYTSSGKDSENETKSTSI